MHRHYNNIQILYILNISGLPLNVSFSAGIGAGGLSETSHDDHLLLSLTEQEYVSQSQLLSQVLSLPTEFNVIYVCSTNSTREFNA